MSTYTEDNRKVTTRRLQEMKLRGEKISMLTAYDFSMASLIDQAGMDVILVGDSASNVMVGNNTTLPITLDEMIFMARSVVNATKRALVVVDMPFGTVAGNPFNSLENAIRMMKETGADALKIEGGEEIIGDIRKIVGAGIPVMGHLGLMPQSINKYGTYNVRAKDSAESDKLKRDVKLLESVGCFGLVLEKIPTQLAKEVTETTTMPTIGIGGGKYTDGQVLVMQDMLGINNNFSPKFLRRYADLHKVIIDAVQHYIKDVKENDFPNEQESY